MKRSLPEASFSFFNHAFLGCLALLSLLPLVNILAVSFSTGYAASTGKVGLWPVDFTVSAYRFVMQNKVFWNTLVVALLRVAAGVPLNLLLVILTAYPLSKTRKEFRQRSFFSWYFLFSMLFYGGLIPYYLTVQAVGLVDRFWVLILPIAVPVYYVIIMLNFFRQIPKELREAAEIDGAGHFATLFRIYVPLSTAAIATIVLLCFIMHWNSWFDGLLFIGNVNRQPLQSYLQSILTRPFDINQMARDPEQWKLIQFVNERTVKCAQIFIATIPIMVIYPYLQKHFTKGLLIGAVKG